MHHPNFLLLKWRITEDTMSSSTKIPTDVKLDGHSTLRPKRGRPRGDFRCRECEYVARDTFNLRLHQKVHANRREKPSTVCEYCGVDMKYPSAYRVHVPPCAKRGGVPFAEYHSAKKAAEQANKRKYNRSRVADDPPAVQFICGRCGVWVMGDNVDRLTHELGCEGGK